MEEFFDVLTEKGQYAGNIETREQCHKQGLWHKAVVVFIINSKKQVLLQRRSPNKKMWPNMWDITEDKDIQNIIILRECIKNHNTIEYFNYIQTKKGEEET